MQKVIVQQLRQRRVEAVLRERAANAQLEARYPGVLEYLNAKDDAEKAYKEFRAAFEELSQAAREELIPTFEFWPEAQVIHPIDAPLRGRRDMSLEAFLNALHRRGFEMDTSAIRVTPRGDKVGYVRRWNKRGKFYDIDRRASLARAIEGARLDGLESSHIV